MTDWILWFAAAGILVTLEIFSGTFYLLMIAAGASAAGIAALLGFASSTQLIVAAIVGAGASYALRRSKIGKSEGPDAARDPNVNLDIGQPIAIDEWKGGEGRAFTARAMYRGALWNIELVPGAVARPGVFTIREVRGSNLIVSSTQPRDN